MQTFFSLFICVNILYIQVTEATVNYTFPFSLESRTSKNFIMFTGFTLQTSYIFVYNMCGFYKFNFIITKIMAYAVIVTIVNNTCSHF